MVPTSIPPREKTVTPSEPEPILMKAPSATSTPAEQLPVVTAPSAMRVIPRSQPPTASLQSDVAPRHDETPRIWLRVSGVALAIAGGLAFSAMDWAQLFNSMSYSAYIGILTVLGIGVGGVASYLLKTWWSLAIVPAAFFVGVLLTDFTMAVLGTNLAGVVAYEFDMLVWYVVPTLIGVAIGTLLALRSENATMPRVV